MMYRDVLLVYNKVKLYCIYFLIISRIIEYYLKILQYVLRLRKSKLDININKIKKDVKSFTCVAIT